MNLSLKDLNYLYSVFYKTEENQVSFTLQTTKREKTLEELFTLQNDCSSNLLRPNLLYKAAAFCKGVGEKFDCVK